MKFTQTGTFQKNFLEKSITTNPKENAPDILLKKLDYLIGFVAKEKPEIITDYVGNLSKKYQGLAEDDFLEDSSRDVEELFAKYENLNQYLDLKKASLNYLFHLLQLKEKSAWKKTEVEITMKAMIQAWTYPTYYFLQALTETIDRVEAVKLFKQYITNYHIDHPPASREKFLNLEKRLKDRLSGDTTSSEWVLVHTLLEDGKYAFKNKNCPTCVDAMVELSDVELKYLACCYGDYAAFKAGANEHIVLTMEHTLMQGHPYCSRVLHDTRIDYDLRHPPKEFWDNFEPGNEEEAKKYYKK